MSKIALAGRQFQQQNVFRSITIGLQPYLPLTQKYRLGLVPPSGPQPGLGYFNMAPQPAGGSTPPQPWQKRINEANTGAYQRTPRKGEPNNWTAAKRQAGALATAPVAAQNLGFLFSRILDGKLAGGIQSRNAAGFRQTDVNELEILMLGKELEKLDPETFKGENSELSNDIVFQKTGKTMSSETFDIMFREAGGSAVQKAITDTFGKSMTKNTTGVEMTVAKAHTRGVKLFSRFGKRDVKDAGGLDKAFEKQVKTTLNKINKAIIKNGKKLDNVVDKFSDVRATFGTTTMHDKFARELIDRIGKLAHASSSTQAQQLAYNYQVPLGTLEEGMMGMVRLIGGTKQGWPQILATDMGVQYVGGSGRDSGNMVDMLLTVAQTNEKAMAENFLETADRIHLASADLAISTEARIASVGEMQYSDVTQNIEGGIDIVVGEKSKRGDGVTGLLPAQIADDLLRQIKEFYSNPGFTTDFAIFFKKLMHSSADLSDKWQESTRGKGRGMSEKFIYGDNDPAFKGYGVWNEGQYNWQDEMIGQNLSISPFLTSRRAGVYAFDGKQATI